MNQRSNACLELLVRSRHDWTFGQMMEVLLRGDPVDLRGRTNRAQIEFGVLLPIEVTVPLSASRIVELVRSDAEVPGEDAAGWIDLVVTDAILEARLSGLQGMDRSARESFLRRLASCLGISDEVAERGYVALHSMSAAHCRAVLTYLPHSLLGITHEEGLGTPRIAQLASDAIRVVLQMTR